MPFEIVDGVIVETIVENGVEVQRYYTLQNLIDNIQAITDQQSELVARKEYFQSMLDALNA